MRDHNTLGCHEGSAAWRAPAWAHRRLRPRCRLPLSDGPYHAPFPPVSLPLPSPALQNDLGQLGLNSSVYSASEPTPVAGGLRFAHLTTWGPHTCGLTGEGKAWCWGVSQTGGRQGPSAHATHAGPCAGWLAA